MFDSRLCGIVLLGVALSIATPVEGQDATDPYPIVELERAVEDLREGPPGPLGSALQELTIRDDEGYWESVESYIGQRSEALFSHSICTDCGPRYYGGHWEPEEADQVISQD